MRNATTHAEQLADRLVFLIIAARIGLLAFASGSYGYFVDEYYYLASTNRPALGYVDHPPLSIWLLGLVRTLFGDSLLAIRLPAALMGGLTVFFTSRLARTLGGGVFAVVVSALAAALVPVYLGINKFYSMNSLDLVAWSAALLLLARILRDGRPGDWVWLGVVLGVGLWNKHSVFFLGFGLFVGLLITPARRVFLARGPWIAGSIALALIVPHIIWQFSNDWPTLEFMHNARLHKNYFTPLDFVKGQLLELNPVFLPLWLAGLGALLFRGEFARFRPLGWVYVSLFALFMITKAKTYYLAPAYPVLLAAGAVWLGQARSQILRVGTVLLLVLSGIAILPMSVPLLAPARYIAYQEWLGIAPPRMERHKHGPMPQHFAGMFGWEEVARAVSDVYQALPERERRRTVAIGNNYGFAGALEFERRRHPLPPAGSPHNSYWAWGPPTAEDGREPKALILVGFRLTSVLEFCPGATVSATAACEFCLPYRAATSVILCRKPNRSLHALWPCLKSFI